MGHHISIWAYRSFILGRIDCVPTFLKTTSSRGRRGFAIIHGRFQGSRWVYPVLSRRSGGISVGVNITPDRCCNFNCIYCQVDRASPITPEQFQIEPFKRELRDMLELIVAGEIYRYSPFDEAPPAISTIERYCHQRRRRTDGVPLISRRPVKPAWK